MPTKTITVGNARQRVNDEWVDWKPGDDLIPTQRGTYSLKVGHKGEGGWENFYVNDPKLFSTFRKGAKVLVEYSVNKGGYNVIRGVGETEDEPSGKADAKVENGDREHSIRLQTYAKAWGTVQQGNHKMTPEVFAAAVLAIDKIIELGIKPGQDVPKDKLDELVEKAKATLGAEEIADDDQQAEEFPF